MLEKLRLILHRCNPPLGSRIVTDAYISLSSRTVLTRPWGRVLRDAAVDSPPRALVGFSEEATHGVEAYATLRSPLPRRASSPSDLRAAAGSPRN